MARRSVLPTELYTETSQERFLQLGTSSGSAMPVTFFSASVGTDNSKLVAMHDFLVKANLRQINMVSFARRLPRSKA